MSDTIERAMRVAVRAHAGQTRKESDLPYISHPCMVALILARHGFEDAVIAAGLTHDVLEDTEVGEEELRSAIGEEAFAIVTEVTNDDTLGWTEKKQKYIDTVRTAEMGAKAVATADKIHNAQSLLMAYEEQGPALWAHFNAGREKKLWFETEMLRMLEETWTHPLVDEYAELVRKMAALP